MAKIRNARVEDIPRLVEWGEEFWNHTYFKQVQDEPYCGEAVGDLCRGLIEGEDGYILVVVDDEDDVRGFALCITYPFVFNPAIKMSGELAWYIDPTLRGGKLGLYLLKLAEKIAKFMGVKYMTMISMEHSMDVGPLYERAGYMKTESTYVKEL